MIVKINYDIGRCMHVVNTIEDKEWKWSFGRTNLEQCRT